MDAEDDQSQKAIAIEGMQSRSLTDRNMNQDEMVSAEDLEEAENELSKQRRRVREKQKLMMELIKQQVAMTKLKRRNQAADKLRNESQAENLLDELDDELDFTEEIHYDDSQMKIHLPVLFIECQPNSEIKVSQSDSKKHMKLRTDRKFTMMDENYLFNCMGLTKTTSDEIKGMISPKITNFLQRNELVKVTSRQ